jgi:hypothetical protein
MVTIVKRDKSQPAIVNSTSLVYLSEVKFDSGTDSDT